MLARRGNGRVANTWWHRFLIKRRGKQDGRLGIPPQNDAAPSPFERELMAQAGQLIEDAITRYTERIQVLEGRYNAAVARLENAVGEYCTELERYEAKKRALGRGVTVHLQRGWYRAILVLIGIGELAFNFQAFQVFQKPLPLTFLMALAVAVGLPVCGHFVGVNLKQWPSPTWKTVLFLLLALGGGIVCVVGVNIARSEYLKLLDAELAPLESVLHNAFLMINLFVLVIAIITSIMAHDNDPEFEKLYEDVQRLNRRCRGMSDQILELAGRIDALRTELDAEAKLVQAVYEELTQIYRGHNQRARSDPALPTSFKQRPQLPVLRQLVEKQPMIPLEHVNEILNAWSQARRRSVPVNDAGGL